MRHVYACPLRWADLDQLGHVNNAVFVDYLQEARVDLMRAWVGGSRQAGAAEGVVVVRHEVSYVAPLTESLGTFTVATVQIECWVTEIRAASFTMAYEVFDERDGARVVYARARTVLAPYVFETERPRRLTETESAGLAGFLEPEPRERRTPTPDVPRTQLGHYPVRVRFSDVDVYGHVNNVKYFEYLQEGRIALLARLAQRCADPAGALEVVVAQTDVDYRAPILLRAEPYDLWSTITRVGRTSLQIDSEIRDGEQLCARAQVTLVFWDRGSGAPAQPQADVRAVLEAVVAH